MCGWVGVGWRQRKQEKRRKGWVNENAPCLSPLHRTFRHVPHTRTVHRPGRRARSGHTRVRRCRRGGGQHLWWRLVVCVPGAERGEAGGDESGTCARAARGEKGGELGGRAEERKCNGVSRRCVSVFSFPLFARSKMFTGVVSSLPSLSLSLCRTCVQTSGYSFGGNHGKRVGGRNTGNKTACVFCHHHHPTQFRNKSSGERRAEPTAVSCCELPPPPPPPPLEKLGVGRK